ncbi:MAG: hypoxanthine phosphoribosyltransferase [Deltaproteobacteria bacterium]|nr:hypoxanthine phosphoribosyltransferase [Deltaproteobacteria bacterium]NIS77490.1 hypoxanthine phosphoribosyltransferase [Deltaproteobacteria bacterium]
MGRDKFKILFPSGEIELKVKELAKQISQDYRGKTPVLIGILKGAFIFLADLVRSIEGVDVEIDFLGVSSYGKKTAPDRSPIITKDLSIDVANRDVIIVEDIVDTGATFDSIVGYIAGKNPSSLKICSLVDKRGRRKGTLKIDYVGFEIESGFIIGYGMDFSEKYRNIKDILLYLEDAIQTPRAGGN